LEVPVDEAFRPVDGQAGGPPLNQYGVRQQIGILLRLGPRRLGALLYEAYNEWAAAGASRLGAGLAYFALFSIAPLLIVVTGVAGLFLGRAAARGEVAPLLERAFSREGAQAVEVMLRQVATPQGGILATIMGLVSLFLAASALVHELRQSLNTLWNVNTPATEGGFLAALRSMFSDRLYALAIVVGAGLLLIGSMIVNAGVAAAGAYVGQALPVPELLLQSLNLLMAFTLSTVFFALIYKSVPDARVSFGDAVVGAIVTALLCDLGSFTLSMFLGKGASTSVYGTAGSVLALLVWVYYTAQVFFFGAEVTRVFANRYGAGIEATHHSLGTIVRRRRR
jgi:membrane protein